MATHVADRGRIAKLQRCLASIEAQEQPPTQLLVSWSCEPELQEEVEALLGAERSVAVRAARLGAKASQFQHYGELARQLTPAQRETCWLFFSDDDDLWHPRRVGHFRNAAGAAAERGQAVAGVFRDARPMPWAAAADPPMASPSKAADVDLFLRLGAVEQTGDSGLRGERLCLEYFHYCVKASFLCSFVDDAPDEVLASPFCDLAFAATAKAACIEAGDDFSLYDPGPDDWMYFYDRPDCLSQHSADVETLGIAPGEALEVLALLRTNVAVMLLEGYPRLQEERVLSTLVPMLLDREGADPVQFLGLSWERLRGELLTRSGGPEVSAAESLVRFYMSVLAQSYGLRR